MDLTTKHLKTLLNRMGNPEKLLKVVHVGGTNGKGSVCKMIEGVLIQLDSPNHSFKVGTFMSPSPIDDKNGICINNINISDSDYRLCSSKVNHYLLKMEQANEILPSEFELLVAITICYFTMSKVDIAIFEVGMGGLNDATNVFDHPLLSIITSIDYDHMDFLGDTLELIAEEKAGIIKTACPVILGDMPHNAKEVILQTAAKTHAPAMDLFKEPLQAQSRLHYQETQTSKHPIIQEITYLEDYSTYSCRLLGKHQISNLYVAINALKHLSTSFPEILGHIHKTGDIIWPCRQEYFHTTYDNQLRNFLFDGAHNKQSIDALIDTCKNYFSHKRILVVFSALKDKDLNYMLKKLSTISEELIITDIDHERGTPLSELTKIAENYFTHIVTVPSASSALSYAIQHLTRSSTQDDYIHKATGLAQSYPDLILVTGSLYLTIPLRNQVIQ